METYNTIHGIVLYTIKDDATRETIQSFIQEELKGQSIDQSTYSLPQTGCPCAKEKLLTYIKENKNTLRFKPDDYLGICFAVCLIDTNATINQKDQIALFKLL